MKQWWNWRKRDAELEKEIQHHLRMAEEERAERGASPGKAQAEARRELRTMLRCMFFPIKRARKACSAALRFTRLSHA